MKKILLFLTIGLMYGCASNPQLPVALDDNYLQPKMKVGVVMDEIPAANVYLPGASCLLCLAAAEAANSNLSSHVESWTPKEFTLVESELVTRLEENGVDVVAIDDQINFRKLPKFQSDVPNSAKKDLRGFKNQYGIDQLLVIDIDMIGIERPYSSYIPAGDPKAILKGVAYLVDLTDNTYKWYKPISLYKAADGEWKEPPNYPGLTNAFYHVIEVGREAVLSEF
ncbi:hypothetical protein [Teredinibacter franksiae]|uniref:hypothetical protein n=1 Tax=Teredinibacter franksiae TaxID=2761453 RepID=UPI0016298890|nr:hypothetical protein [Teredinibacter franksiae]